MNFFDIHNIVATLWGYDLSYLELIGFITGFVSIYLAGKGHVLTFWIGLLNCAVFFSLFYQQHLYSMMLLQFVFASINIYGIIKWTFPKKSEQNAEKKLRISTLSTKALISYMLTIVLGGVAWGWFMVYLSNRFPDFVQTPAYPYVDAILLISNVIGQTWVARKKIENWALWILVDSASCILWLVMGMKLTALLYVLYVIISVYAWFNWRKQLDEERALARAKKKNH